MVFWHLIHPEHRKIIKLLGEKREQGESVPSRYEVKLKNKSGEDVWVDFSACYLEYQGEPFILGTSFDITARKNAEEALRASESRYRKLTENARDTIWRTDTDGIVKYVNPTIFNLLGYKPAEAIGLKVDDYLDPDSLEKIKNKIISLAKEKSKDHFNIEAKYIHKSGALIDVDLMVTLITTRQTESVPPPPKTP